MTFIKEFLLAIIILALITSGVIFYYTNGDPLFFYESIGWALEPKNHDIAFIEKITWLKIHDASKVKNIFPTISTPPHKQAFLFIAQENNEKDNPLNTATKASLNKNDQPEIFNSISSTEKNKFTFTLVCKGGPVISWQSVDSSVDKTLKLGKPKQLSQPVANIVLQILIQKPWRHIKDYKPSIPKNWHINFFFKQHK